MEALGITSYKGQPTITNPLDAKSSLQGQESLELTESETINTVSAQGQEPEQMSVTFAVEQSNETDKALFDRRYSGATIDFFV